MFDKKISRPDTDEKKHSETIFDFTQSVAGNESISSPSERRKEGYLLTCLFLKEGNLIREIKTTTSDVNPFFYIRIHVCPSSDVSIIFNQHYLFPIYLNYLKSKIDIDISIYYVIVYDGKRKKILLFYIALVALHKRTCKSRKYFFITTDSSRLIYQRMTGCVITSKVRCKN
ncbi:hypothetical protein PUN28_010574 [Cardiocondyla obscurior]|uniref:Uncharacterized protein n=1 Tax=Cardiocondyla obscurior TaxID=286306 RepID=A0AAW2FL32_9HYME